MAFIDIMTEGSPALDAFEREVARTLQDADLRTAFWRCGDAFETLATSDFLKQVGHGFLRSTLEDPTHRNLQWQVGQAVLIQRPTHSLRTVWSLASTPRDATLISHAAQTILCSLGAAPLLIDMYRLPAVDLDVFEPGATLTYSHQVALAPGQILELDGTHWVADLCPAPRTCLLVFTSAPIDSQVWSFDRASKGAWSTSASSQEATQIKETMGILRRFAANDAAPTVERLCAHPHHDVRWEAIKTLGVLDASRAFERLEQARSDPHPHVRASAARTLSTLQAR